MKRTEIREIVKDHEKFLDQKVRVNGWVRTIRDQKTFGFMELNDGSSFKGIQVVYDDKLENFSDISKFTIYSSVEVEGTVVKSQGAKQPYEIHAEKVTLEGLCDPSYPLQKKGCSVEYLRTIAHLRQRTNLFRAVFRIRSLAANAIHEYFQNQGFTYVHTPLITGSDCEGAGEMFKVTTLDLENLPKTEEGKVDYSQDFFDKSTNLTVSGQLEAETCAMAFGKVYTFGPTFRAENSNTARHAAEFWMVEPEIAFADLEDDMELAEGMVKYIINYCMENAKDEMEFLNSFVDKELIERLNHVRTSDFGRVTYTEAIKILEEAKDADFKFKPYWGCDLQTEHERYLTEKHFKKPVFVTDYPKEIKAFYMKQNEDGKTVAAVDCLVPGIGELIGGSQREENLDKLLNRIHELGLKEEDYSWYLDTRRFGTTKHAGYGLGFERMVMYLTGVSNIRDSILFPRTVHNAEF